MLSINKINEKGFEGKQGKKINRELPYFITMVTLLSSAGIGPYFMLQRVKSMDLLPTIKNETQKMIKRIDLLGVDPLEVMRQVRTRSRSKALGEFFDGYVATVESGGNIVNYLKSKMKTVYDRHAESQKQSVVKLGALVEAYMTIQVVMLAVYIISAAVISDPFATSETGISSEVIFLIITPAISALFLFAANSNSVSKSPELDIKKIVMFAAPALIVSGIVIGLNLIPDPMMEPYLLGGAFIASSIVPTIYFKKSYAMTIASEESTPKILRTISEARKTGMSPEGSVIHACKRKEYGMFNLVANGIANKIEWGVDFKTIFQDMKKDIETFNVLISFNILFELISAGGGNPQTLDSLTETSERMQEIQKEKRDLLMPYLFVGFILMGTTGFTTLLVIDSFGDIAQESQDLSNIEGQVTTSSLGLFPLIVLIQSWTAGLFLGRVIKGAFSGGFFYSIILVIMTLIGITLVQFSIIDVNSLF
ncbi:MAG: type II secretion system F family protein [Nitrosopumilus sp.]|nr:type II secretion system F family protein [Nitrosopumilus sp.]